MRLGVSIQPGDLAVQANARGEIPALLLDFAQRVYRGGEADLPSADLTAAADFTRIGSAIAANLSGALIACGDGVPRQNDAGLLYEAAATNYVPHGAALESGWYFLNGGTGTMPDVPAASVAPATMPSPAGLNADSGKGVTCTGLAMDSLRGLLLVANDGRNLDGNETGNGIWTPSIVLLDSESLEKVGEIALPELNDAGVQGIAHDSEGDLYAVVVPSAASIRFIDPETGASAGSLELPAPITAPNGLAYDSARDCFWVSDNVGNALHRVSRDGALLFTYHPAAPELPIDHLHYDATGDRLLLTNGANGVDGRVWAYSPELDRVTHGCMAAGARAIEGVVLRGVDMIVASDGYFHSAPPASIAAPYEANQLLIYPASALLAFRQHRVIADYAELPSLGAIGDRVILDKGAGTSGNDYDLLVTTAVASGAAAVKTLSLWARSTHGDVVTIALRCDSTIRNIIIGPEWQRYAISGTIGTTPTVQLGLRRGGSPYDTSNSADICVALVQLEAGAEATSEIVNTSAGAVTREADVLSIPLPEGVTSATLTFDDGSTQLFSGLSSPWIVPTDLDRTRIRRIAGDPT